MLLNDILIFRIKHPAGVKYCTFTATFGSRCLFGLKYRRRCRKWGSQWWQSVCRPFYFFWALHRSRRVLLLGGSRDPKSRSHIQYWYGLKPLPFPSIYLSSFSFSPLYTYTTRFSFLFDKETYFDILLI